jgi:hypothetical protein
MGSSFLGKLLNPFDANFFSVVFDRLFNSSPHKPYQKTPSQPPSLCTSASACSLFLSKNYSLNDGPCQPIQESTITQHLVFLQIVDEFSGKTALILVSRRTAIRERAA